MSEMDDLATLLLAKTKDGKVSWALESNGRITSWQGKNLIEISVGPDACEILVRNKDGIILISELFEPFQKSYDKLIGIMSKAKRSALRVDEALLDISNRLNAL